MALENMKDQDQTISEQIDDFNTFLDKTDHDSAEGIKAHSDKLMACFNENKKEARELLSDHVKMDHFLQKLERKLKRSSALRKQLPYIPTMISMINHYRKGAEPQLPLRTIIAFLSALIYLVSPVDILPDGIPFIGLLDDIALVAFVWNQASDDVAAYDAWRKEKGM